MKEKLLATLKAQLAILLSNKKLRLYRAALDTIGRDASPDDLANDVVGCAESVTTIMRPIFGNPVILGTATFYEYLRYSTYFYQVTIPETGDILVSPTGMGNGTIQGHTAIVGKNGTLLSNDSYTGKFMANYTLDTWKKRYVDQGNLPMFFFRPK